MSIHWCQCGFTCCMDFFYLQSDFYPWLSTACSPEDLGGCHTEHSGKLKVLFKMLHSVQANKSGERIVIVSHYTQVGIATDECHIKLLFDWRILYNWSNELSIFSSLELF